MKKRVLFPGFLTWSVVGTVAVFASVLPAESQTPPPPDLSECSLDLIDRVLDKCGPSADPKDWYSPLNECTIKAEEAFNLCRDAGHEARIIQIDCNPGPGHVLTQCLLDGKYLTFIDTAAADPARGVLFADRLLSALQNFNPPITPPLTSLFSGETLRDEVACILADRDPTSSDLANRGCGCIWNPLANRSSCSCSAKTLDTYPASGPANTSFCAKSEELSPSGFDPEDCSTCCQNRYRFLMDMEKSTCETFIDSCQLLNWGNLDVGPGGIGLSDELFGQGLIAAWRCGQWPKQAKTFLDGCKKSCSDAAGKLPTITLKPKSIPSVAGSGSIEFSNKNTPAAGRCSVPQTCLVQYPKGKEISFSAKPSPGFKFTVWGGDCRGTTPSCVLNTSTNRSVEATFKKVCALEGEAATQPNGGVCCAGLTKCADGICRRSCQTKVRVLRTGPGQGMVAGGSLISCPNKCVATVARSNKTLDLWASSEGNSAFMGWDGPCLSVTLDDRWHCRIKLDEDRTVTARFDAPCIPQCFSRTCGPDRCGGSCGSCGEGQYCTTSGRCQNNPTLSVSITSGGDGSGAVTFIDGSSCTSSCTKVFNPGYTLTLSAQPTNGSTFGGWSGACTGSSPSCSLVMSESTGVTARFNKACVSDCGTRRCGIDRCGRSCGTCGNSFSCIDGQCVYANTCTPRCEGRMCGADGCGGLCGVGTCPNGYTCTNGQCLCTPQCGGKLCGAPDGCGGLCQGACPNPTVVF